MCVKTADTPEAGGYKDILLTNAILPALEPILCSMDTYEDHKYVTFICMTATLINFFYRKERGMYKAFQLMLLLQLSLWCTMTSHSTVMQK